MMILLIIIVWLFLLTVNWCQHWFEYFPNPPINMLGLVENVLAHHDKELLTHIVKYGVTSQVTFCHWVAAFIFLSQPVYSASMPRQV